MGMANRMKGSLDEVRPALKRLRGNEGSINPLCRLQQEPADFKYRVWFPHVSLAMDTAHFC